MIWKMRLVRWTSNNLPSRMTLLTRIDPEKRVFRYYQVNVQPTLVDDHAVVIAWGSLRTSYGRMRAISQPSPQAAEELAQKIIEKKLNRGYLPTNE